MSQEKKARQKVQMIIVQWPGITITDGLKAGIGFFVAAFIFVLLQLCFISALMAWLGSSIMSLVP